MSKAMDEMIGKMEALNEATVQALGALKRVNDLTEQDAFDFVIGSLDLDIDFNDVAELETKNT